MKTMCFITNAPRRARMFGALHSVLSNRKFRIWIKIFRGLQLDGPKIVVHQTG